MHNEHVFLKINNKIKVKGDCADVINEGTSLEVTHERGHPHTSRITSLAKHQTSLKSVIVGSQN